MKTNLYKQIIEKQDEYIEKLKRYTRHLLLPLQMRDDEWLLKGVKYTNVLNEINSELLKLKVELENYKGIEDRSDQIQINDGMDD